MSNLPSSALPRLCLLATLLPALTACEAKAEQRAVPVTAPSYDHRFWQHWGDGRAELAAYDLTFPRYGELRRGSAVSIFVTETFSDSARVKADPGRHPKSDEVPVMKLNLVLDFQTGVYDYNTMTSTFVQLAPRGARPAGSPTKISFSSQEWCGQVWHQLLFDDESIREVSHSYFDGEADVDKRLEAKAGGVSEDVLLFWARGLAAPVLARGERREVSFLPSVLSSRLSHTPLAWKRVTLAVQEATTEVTVPAGTFEVEVRTATEPGGLERKFYVETAWPHRVVLWEASDGTRAELRGSERMKYWEMNQEGQEQALRRLGLPPPRR